MNRPRYVVKYKNPYPPGHQYHEWGARRAGRYEKLGGGLTDSLSEAAVIGWKSSRFADTDLYQMIPVNIVIVEPA